MHFKPHDRGGEVGPWERGWQETDRKSNYQSYQPAPTYMGRLHREAESRLRAKWAVLEDGCNRSLTLVLNN